MEEVFKNVDGFENYSISNTGKIYSKVSGKMKACQVSGRGYLIASLYRGEPYEVKRKTFSVHRLVAQAFVSNPLNLKTVNHIDGNKFNNHYTNLEWCSQQENLAHARGTGLLDVKGSKHGMSKLLEGDIPFIRYWYNIGFKQKDIAEAFSVSRACISAVINNKRWGHI